MRKRIMLVLAAAIVCGCNNYTKPVAKQPVLSEEERNFQAVWQASQDVLNRYYFNINHMDRREGVIVTDRVTGKHWFEFWRQDGATTWDTMESSIQTIYRQATVKVIRTSPESTIFQAQVEVQSFRSDRQQPQITSTADAYKMFLLPGQGSQLDQFLLDYGKTPQNTMVSLGRDKGLEQKLENAIRSATGQVRIENQ